MADIQTKGVGIRFHEPALFIVYQDVGSGKYRRRKIPIKQVPAQASQAARDIYQRHGSFMKNISLAQIERLLEHIQMGKTPSKIQDIHGHEKGPLPIPLAQSNHPKPALSDIHPRPVLSEVHPRPILSEVHSKPVLSLSEVHPKPALSEINSKPVLSEIHSKPAPTDTPQDVPIIKVSPNAHQVVHTSSLVPIDGNLDLNKMSDQELAKYKKMMDEQFEKNRILPGQKEFVYDIQKTFGEPTSKSEWDDSEDEDETVSRPRVESHIPNSLSDVSIKSHVVTNPSALVPVIKDDVTDIPEDVLSEEEEEEEEVTPTQQIVETKITPPKPSLLGPLPTLGPLSNKNHLPSLSSAPIKPLGPLQPLSKPLTKPDPIEKSTFTPSLLASSKDQEIKPLKETLSDSVKDPDSEPEIDDILDMLDDEKDTKKPGTLSFIKSPIETRIIESKHSSSIPSIPQPPIVKSFLGDHDDISPIVPTATRVVEKQPIQYDEEDDYEHDSFIEEDIASLPDDSPTVLMPPPTQLVVAPIQKPVAPLAPSSHPTSVQSSPRPPIQKLPDPCMPDDNFGQGETDSELEVGDDGDVEFDEDALDVLSFDKGSDNDENDQF